MTATVRTAVFPVAGRGTRFLPATKAVPKEMLPIVDKPLIQFAVEEALEAGATRLVFITHSSKRAIEDHFDQDPELERALIESGKDELLERVRGVLPKEASCVFIRQGEPLGLGHAVLCAEPAVGNEPFFVHLPDDLIYGNTGCLAQMAVEYESHGSSSIAVEDVPREKTGSYGIVDVDESQRL
jgi:UTP--glucose-1-phosphate uridylyltransferase